MLRSLVIADGTLRSVLMAPAVNAGQRAAVVARDRPMAGSAMAAVAGHAALAALLIMLSPPRTPKAGSNLSIEMAFAPAPGAAKQTDVAEGTVAVRNELADPAPVSAAVAGDADNDAEPIRSAKPQAPLPVPQPPEVAPNLPIKAEQPSPIVAAGSFLSDAPSLPHAQVHMRSDTSTAFPPAPPTRRIDPVLVRAKRRAQTAGVSRLPESRLPESRSTQAPGVTDTNRSPAATQAAASPPALAARADGGWEQGVMLWLESHRSYPPAALRRGEQGTALVRLTVNRGGRVVNFALLQSTGSSRLDSAVEALLSHADLPPFPASMPQDQYVIAVPIRYRLTS